MRSRTGPVLAIGFGTLLVLITLSGLAMLRTTRQIYSQIGSLYDSYERSSTTLNELRTEVHLSGVLVRDYLLDPSHLTAGMYRQQLLELRTSMGKELDALRGMLGPEDAPTLERLREELDRYWDSLDPLFEWTPREKLAFSAVFLRQQVLPRRNAVLALARELRQLNLANLKEQREEIDRKQAELPKQLGRMLAATLLLGLIVSAVSIRRIHALEQRTEREWRRAEQAEQELRRLSQELVRAQEEERRAISRELHDEVGQMLTALRMEVRNLEQLRDAPAEQFRERAEEARRLSENALRTVRDLAMGLRPSMLDDLGLGPAVEWQAREFSRRFGVPVSVELDGALDNLPDRQRTCVYRIVQEALTNCARHAQARDIRVTIHGREDSIIVTVQDDGVGFDPAQAAGRGLGLLGIQERVRELGGRVHILSQPGRGTLLTAEVPLRTGEVTHEQDSYPAG
ncbi:MAG: histidine kinase [Bryobacterales bacterium]|nr:histidine kinase [Bryobacteraceae bacterium]MDW8129743.1 histidine kinase [Bryobacterales bacterium]